MTARPFKPLHLAALAIMMPVVGARALKFIEPLNAAMREFEIDTPDRMRDFMAHVAHESGQLKRVVENLNYTPDGILATFGARFTRAEALQFGRTETQPANQVAIASIAYGNRMGNGPAKTGDGWKYRGRGLIQITGRENYIACMMGTGIDCVERPELLEEPVEACRSAAWFWKSRGLNALADKGDFHRQTKIVNGGYNGLEERLHFRAEARKVIS